MKTTVFRSITTLVIINEMGFLSSKYKYTIMIWHYADPTIKSWITKLWSIEHWSYIPDQLLYTYNVKRKELQIKLEAAFSIPLLHHTITLSFPMFNINTCINFRLSM